MRLSLPVCTRSFKTHASITVYLLAHRSLKLGRAQKAATVAQYPAIGDASEVRLGEVDARVKVLTQQPIRTHPLGQPHLVVGQPHSVVEKHSSFVDRKQLTLLVLCLDTSMRLCVVMGGVARTMRLDGVDGTTEDPTRSYQLCRGENLSAMPLRARNKPASDDTMPDRCGIAQSGSAAVDRLDSSRTEPF